MGSASDVQENMIESGHAQDAAPRRARLLALQRDARADGRDARGPRRARHRPAGRRHAHLHVHLHDGELPVAAANTGSLSSSAIGPIPSAALAVEGPMLDAGFESFVGQYPIPDAARHDDWRARAALQRGRSASAPSSRSSRCSGWSRDQYFDATGLPWVLPSPNLPTLDSAIVYPGTVLFEGTNVSEGRGTTRPFELWWRAVG